IDAEIIAEIARHEFPASSLWRIHLTAGRILPGDSCLFMDDPNRFPTFESLLPHLLAYFSVLASCARSSGKPDISFTLMNGSYSYTESLVEMTTQFKWSDVLGYHIQYMSKRQDEMRRGIYSGWGPIDLDL
ncbi:hypothetical protein F5879DRAFT_783491, partial [Lentinula edodes]|uniref:uncharacterized protein n=1 Tax=Lentinula edodes TaxID=5353 RepID=UPI001E8EAD83